MNDPYKVLGVPSTATDDEVKKAYRDLARKYHPDNYHDNPLEDLAQEKMKVINEAYEEIQTQRKKGATSYSNPGASSYGGNPYGNPFAGNPFAGSYQSYGGDPAFQRVRMTINQGDLNMAEELLNAMSDHNAEWNFLKGVICNKRGRMDEARRYFTTAVQMEPDNGEYQRALDMAEGRNEPFQPNGFGPFSTGSCDNSSCLKYCCIWACCNAMGGGGYWFCC